MHWVRKAVMQEIIGGELQKRGWEVYDYRPHVSDPMNDYGDFGHWCGLATHPKAPGVTVSVMPRGFGVLDAQTPGLLVITKSVSTEVKEKPLPPYSNLKKGMTWQIEREGEFIKAGRIPRVIDDYRWMEEGETALKVFVDKIEALAFR